MKLWQKIFLSSLSLVIIAINVISILLVNNSHRLQIEREQEHAISEYDYFAASLANNVIYERMRLEKLMLSPSETEQIISDITASGSQGYSSSAVYNEAYEIIGNYNIQHLTEIPEFEKYISHVDTSSGDYNIKVFNSNNRYFLTVCSELTIEGKNYIIVTASDISEIYSLKEQQVNLVRQISIITAAIISLILLIAVILLLRPLNRINIYTKAIASGKYNIRIKCRGSIELRELSENMNSMADSIESNAARLEKIAEDRQTFIANLAHEMKTPLTSILGFADLLRIKKNVSAKERTEYAGIILEETRRLRSLSGKLMELITIGSTEIEKTPVSLEKMINDTGTALTPLLNKNKVTLLCRTEDITINADEELFKSLLYNLIENAVKASAIGQRIELFSKMYKGDAVISITDSGIGMSQDDIQRVFEPFYMVDKSRSRKAGGAGLGLALCAKIAEMHHAKLSIESEIGKGTTIYIIISGEECI